MRNNYSKSERLDMMKNNLKRNCPDIIFDDWMFPVFEKLSVIEFDDVIVQYSSYDNCLDFWFYIGEYKFSLPLLMMIRIT